MQGVARLKRIVCLYLKRQTYNITHNSPTRTQLKNLTPIVTSSWIRGMHIWLKIETAYTTKASIEAIMTIMLLTFAIFRHSQIVGRIFLARSDFGKTHT